LHKGNGVRCIKEITNLILHVGCNAVGKLARQLGQNETIESSTGLVSAWHMNVTKTRRSAATTVLAGGAGSNQEWPETQVKDQNGG
jgi:hypothetical protein